MESPANDFHETPPGLLPLHTMVYFARKHQEQYVKVRMLLSSLWCNRQTSNVHFSKSRNFICKIVKVNTF